jgi:hypothetical protein
VSPATVVDEDDEEGASVIVPVYVEPAESVPVVVTTRVPVLLVSLEELPEFVILDWFSCVEEDESVTEELDPEICVPVPVEGCVGFMEV